MRKHLDERVQNLLVVRMDQVLQQVVVVVGDGDIGGVEEAEVPLVAIFGESLEQFVEERGAVSAGVEHGVFGLVPDLQRDHTHFECVLSERVTKHLSDVLESKEIGGGVVGALGGGQPWCECHIQGGHAGAQTVFEL